MLILRAVLGPICVWVGKLLYMSRGSASWRKLVGETEILDRWNRDHTGGDSLNVFRPEGLSFAEQLQQIAGARALVGVNGAQILSCLFLPPGTIPSRYRCPIGIVVQYRTFLPPGTIPYQMRRVKGLAPGTVTFSIRSSEVNRTFNL